MPTARAVATAVAVSCAAVGVVNSIATAQTAAFASTGPNLNGGAARAFAVTADGSCVVGYLGDDAFVWRPPAQPTLIPPLPGDSAAQAYGVSADGTIVVGRSGRGYPFRSFRWSVTEGTQELVAPLGVNLSEGVGAGPGGSVIVGSNRTPTSDYAGYWWTADAGMLQLWPLQSPTRVLSLSPDGTVAVGQLGQQPALWTGPQSFTVLPTQFGFGFATGVANGGAAVVGLTASGEGGQAFRWTPTTGMNLLGTDGEFREALGVSHVGNVVVGTTVSGGLQAIIWTADMGVRRVDELLAQQGVNLTGWALSEARAASATGEYIAGFGCGPSGLQEAWLARIILETPCAADVNQSGAVSIQDVFDFLTSYFAGDFLADFNGSRSVTVQDIFDFLAAYFAGCP